MRGRLNNVAFVSLCVSEKIMVLEVITLALYFH